MQHTLIAWIPGMTQPVNIPVAEKDADAARDAVERARSTAIISDVNGVIWRVNLDAAYAVSFVSQETQPDA